MKSGRHLAGAVALALFAGSLLLAPARVSAQDDPYAGLKTYDFQDRTAASAIYKMIQDAAGDKAKDADIEQHLIMVLQDPTATFAGKEEAGRMLWIIGSSKSVPVLAKMLTEEKLGNVARYALERSPDPAAGKALISALDAAKGPALVGIINSIGDRGDPAAAGALKRFTSNADPLVADAAVAALGKIGTASAIAALNARPPSRLVDQALIRAAEHLTASGKSAQAERVYLSLAKAKQPAVVQADALEGLVAIRSPRAPGIAFTDLRSPDAALQVVAARVCGGFSDARSTQRSVAAWPDLPVPTQVILLASMADRHETAASPLALKATQSGDPILRTTGIRAAAQVGGAEVVPALVEIAARDDSDGQTARDALALMPGKATDEAILKAAADGSPKARTALMQVLADRPSAAATALLIRTAAGADSGVAVAAIRTLGKTGGVQEAAALVKLLAGTTGGDVRDAAKDAVVAMGKRTGDPTQAAAPLLAAMPDASTDGKVAILSALAEIGSDSALAALTDATTAPTPEVKAAAVSGLADTWSDGRPLDTLAGVAKGDESKSLRVQALRGFIRLVGIDHGLTADEKVAKLTDAVALAQRPEEKIQALSVLRNCRVVSAMELASKLLDDPALFDDAASTVVYLAAPQRRGSRQEAAVTGAASNIALDKIIQMTKDDNLKAEAERLKQ
ncbi:MAG TPA: HEAT repeat domain-containing protein [Armatimonadota bacterium]|nr:HEAT repeat domain-containing protein [Armatimonadota bacterium]